MYNRRAYNRQVRTVSKIRCSTKKKAKVYYCCLRFLSDKCRKKKISGVGNCNRSNCILLHKNKEYLAPHSKEIPKSMITCTNLLNLLPAKIKGRSGIFNISALLDDRSTTTLIESSTST